MEWNDSLLILERGGIWIDGHCHSDSVRFFWNWSRSYVYITWTNGCSSSRIYESVLTHIFPTFGSVRSIFCLVVFQTCCKHRSAKRCRPYAITKNASEVLASRNFTLQRFGQRADNRYWTFDRAKSRFLYKGSSVPSYLKEKKNLAECRYSHLKLSLTSLEGCRTMSACMPAGTPPILFSIVSNFCISLTSV